MKLTPALGRFANQVARAFRNFKYDLTHDGRLLISGSSAQLGGMFRHRADILGNGIWTPPALDHNRVVTQGLIDMALVYFKGGSQTASFYIAPFANDIEVQADLDAENFADIAGEVTAYTPNTRMPWVTGAVTTVPSVHNTASPAQLTFTAGGPFNLRGCGLLTASAKESISGKLIAASRFENDYTGLNTGSKFACEYIFNLLDEADVP